LRDAETHYLGAQEWKSTVKVISIVSWLARFLSVVQNQDRSQTMNIIHAKVYASMLFEWYTTRADVHCKWVVGGRHAGGQAFRWRHRIQTGMHYTTVDYTVKTMGL
jgi:hypothetical protein